MTIPVLEIWQSRYALFLSPNLIGKKAGGAPDHSMNTTCPSQGMSDPSFLPALPIFLTHPAYHINRHLIRVY